MADQLTTAEAERWAEPYESSLRRAYPDGLPPEWQARIDEVQGDTLVSHLLRWFWWKHYYVLHQEQRAAAAESKVANVQATARQLLRREPVRVMLAGREVPVTSRSYNAMAEIAAHDLRIRHLSRVLDEIAVRHSLADVDDADPQTRAHARRYAGRLEELHRRVYTELMKHRRALYAHALTPTGAAARDVETDAPVWWREMTPDDDARLLVALIEAGPVRYHQLGDPPAPKNGKPAPKREEDFGYMSLLSTWERTLDLQPAALHDTDLAQLLTYARAAAPPSLEDSLKD